MGDLQELTFIVALAVVATAAPDIQTNKPSILMELSLVWAPSILGAKIWLKYLCSVAIYFVVWTFALVMPMILRRIHSVARLDFATKA